MLCTRACRWSYLQSPIQFAALSCSIVIGTSYSIDIETHFIKYYRQSIVFGGCEWLGMWAERDDIEVHLLCVTTDQAPPRPPLPRDTAPPRPPPPETDDEDETSFPVPQSNQPIMVPPCHAQSTSCIIWLMTVASLRGRGEGVGGPPWVTPSGGDTWTKKKFCGWICKE